MDLETTALDASVRRRHGKQLEDAILDAAWDQLVDGGYGNFTIDAVAERAGTSRSVIYRRWADRDALMAATIGYGLMRRSPIVVPDTGTLRGDLIELLRRSSASRGQLAPLLSVLVGSYFSDTGGSFADIRRQMLGDRTRTGMDDIIDRAIERGEVDSARLTPRVRTVAFDLFRHDLMMTLRPVPDDEIIAIVDEVFLPLVIPARG